MRKYASFKVIAAAIAQPGSPLMRTAHRAVFQYDPRPGYLYVRSRAISSRTNDNFDTFPAEEIKQAYASFIGKPVFVNHHNDNHRRARGVIIDAVLHEDTTPQGKPDTWVEVLMEVDAVRFPKLAQAILAGEIDRTSMGCDVAYSLCSFCGNKARTPIEYCSHIPRLKGKKIRRVTASGAREDVLVSEICYGLKFFENSLLVEDPADPTAFFLGEVDARGVPELASKYRSPRVLASKTASTEKTAEQANLWSDDKAEERTIPVCGIGESISIWYYPSDWPQIESILPRLLYGPGYSRGALENIRDYSREVKRDNRDYANQWLNNALRAAGIDERRATASLIVEALFTEADAGQGPTRTTRARDHLKGHEVIQHMLQNGGWSINDRGQHPQSGYMVSHPGSEQVEPDMFHVTPHVYEDYAKKHRDRLSNPKNYSGGWVDDTDGKTYLDVSENVRSKEDAITRAHQRDQLGIYDVKNQQTIDTRDKSKSVFSSVVAARAEEIARVLFDDGFPPAGPNTPGFMADGSSVTWHEGGYQNPVGTKRRPDFADDSPLPRTSANTERELRKIEQSLSERGYRTSRTGDAKQYIQVNDPISPTAASRTKQHQDHYLHTGCTHNSMGRTLHRKMRSESRRVTAAPPQPSFGRDVPWLKAGADSYMRANGNEPAPKDWHAIRSDKILGSRTAAAYEAMPTNDPAAHPAYDALKQEVRAQFDHLTNDLGVKVDFVKDDPYPSIHELSKDLRENHRIAVLKTSETGSHPYLTDEENDMFRAVHDAFGHAAIGRGFDRHGEEAAYQHHRQMFSGLAQGALASETRGQNAALVYGGYGKRGEFPEQKVGILPRNIIEARKQVMAARDDIHSPKNFVPGDYQLLGVFYQGDNSDWHMIYQEDHRHLDSELSRLGASFDYGNVRGPWFDGNFKRRGTCDHCGARFAHGAVFLHKPTGELIVSGQQCAEKLGLANEADFQMYKKQKEYDRLQEKARVQKARQEFIRSNPRALQLLQRLSDYDTESNSFWTSLINQLDVQKGYWSDRQMDALEASMDREDENKLRQERMLDKQKDAHPCPNGTETITGEVVSTKWVESQYGGSLKMLVLDDRGFKVWGTVPGSLDADRGDRVSFVANIEQSNDDQYFGFFKRPRKATKVSFKTTADRWGDVTAPQQVDTLRDPECAVCGETEAWDGNQCQVCGYVQPPSMYTDPNVDTAAQVDRVTSPQPQAPITAPKPAAAPGQPTIGGPVQDDQVPTIGGPVADEKSDAPPSDPGKDSSDAPPKTDKTPASPDDKSASPDASKDTDSSDDSDDKDGKSKPPWLKDDKKKASLIIEALFDGDDDEDDPPLGPCPNCGAQLTEDDLGWEECLKCGWQEYPCPHGEQTIDCRDCARDRAEDAYWDAKTEGYRY